MPLHDVLSFKPRLICLEGPAGVGKTTLCTALSRALAMAGIPSVSIPEFSATTLGRSLSGQLVRFGPPPRLEPEVVFGRCVSDKLRNLAAASATRSPGWLIADRGLVTQWVLGVPAIRDPDNRASAGQLLARASNELSRTFTVTTLFLSAPFDQHLSRLSGRLRRSLSRGEAAEIQRERDAYRELGTSERVTGLGTEFLDCSDPAEVVAHNIVTRIFRDELSAA